MVKQVVCPTCGLVFDRAAKLKRHILTHKNEGFECTVCNKKIKSKANFDRHVKSHDRTHKCDVCEITFKQRQSLNAHLNRVHGPKLADRRLKCPECNHLSKSRGRLYAHRAAKHLVRRQCDSCLAGFKTARAFVSHQKRCQLKNDTLKYVCFVCRKRYATLHEKNRHVKICRRTNNQLGGAARRPGPAVPAGAAAARPGAEASDVIGEWDQPTFALRGAAQVIRYHPGGSGEDLGLSLIDNKHGVVQKLKDELKQARGLKWSLSVSVEVSRETEKNQQVEVERETKTLFSETRRILVGGEEEENQVESAFLDILNSAENLKIQGSSWVVSQINFYELSLAKFKPLRGGSYLKTPSWIARKRVVVNIETRANHECFRLSILASLFPATERQRAADPRSYTEHYDALQFGNIPSKNMKIRDVKKFCKQNQDFSLGIIGVEKKELFPLFCPEERKLIHITLLLLTRRRKRHYVLCTSLDTLLYSQNKHKHKKNFCCYCFSSFNTQQSRVNHERECREFGGQKIKYPPPGSYLKFGARHIRQMSPVPFLVAYDFETLCCPVEGGEGGRKTRRTNVHVPFCYCVVVVDFQGTPMRDPIVYSCGSGEELIHHFLDTLFDIEEECFSKRPDYPIDISVEQELEFERAQKCWICEQSFTDPEDLKVRDHSPLLQSSNFIGASHRSCNLLRTKALFLPAICHNSSKFDLHMIIQWASKHKKFRKCDINILPRNMEVYRSMTLVIDKKRKREIRFLDSYQHFSTNLSDLLQSLSDSSWNLLRQFFPDKEQHSLLMQKGTLCYDFLTSFEKVKNQKILPPRHSFYNRLRQEAVSEEEYSRAERVWTTFQCDSLLSYVEIYCLTDVVGLMAFFLTHREVTASVFGYEVCHFVSTPSLSLACAVKFTKCHIPLISCPNKFLKFEKSIRGGLSGAVLRYAKANNCFTPGFNPEEPISHILYSDVNALYSYSLAGEIPAGDFTWLSPEECESICIQALHASSHGVLFEVDLAYGILPGETSHHEDWPLAPAHLCPNPTWFSEYQRRVAASSGFNYAQQTKKLMSVIGPRENYLIHSTLLEFYLEKGMKVTRFHAGIKYRTEAWLKPFIDFLMAQRQQTKIPFMSSYFKLQSNSLYGSFLRRPRADRSVKICQTEKAFLKLTSKASFKGFRIFAKDMCAVESLKKEVNLCQPIFVASAILDHSKMHITKLFWEMKSHFSAQKDKKLELQAFDTDSILCKVTTPEICKDLEALSHIFDFSSLPKWHPLHNKSKERVPGYLKLEFGGHAITEMVAVKSKCYAINYVPLPAEYPAALLGEAPEGPGGAGGAGAGLGADRAGPPAGQADSQLQIMRRCKGIPASALNKYVDFSHYKKCVFEGFNKEISFFAIKSDGLHNVYTVNQQKRCLSAFDNKRKILPCGIKTLPYCVGLDGCEMPWPAEKDLGEENLKELVSLMDEEEEQDEDEDEGALNLKQLLALWDTVM